VKVETPLSDDDVRRILTDYLREHGPTRSKSLTNRAGTPYERSIRVLEAMRERGEVEQVPAGTWRGLPTLAWALPGDARVTRRFTFGASATLAAMQAAARASLMQRVA
jgi:hypothetical protein